MPAGDPPRAVLSHDGQLFGFCSEFCKRQFERQPGAYDVTLRETRRSVAWQERRVAYFTMEVALTSRVPTYAGGLGVLAGDTLLSCADLEVPIVGVSLVHRQGYFRQELQQGRQLEKDATDLYEKLERVVLPSFYDDRTAWVAIMRQCIALNASFFNTHRMVRQYLLHAYALGE
jgi:glucan phosphorylase